MRQFIPAETLKRLYEVFGHFYSVSMSSNCLVECRSVLEIVATSHAPGDRAELSEREPDAVFIMMNPGSSRPLENASHRVLADQIGSLSVTLVRTKPDTTQYQVMRVMHFRQWRHVRVLNLSDLRCSNSRDFFKRYRQLEVDSNYDAHSLFSASRGNELALKLPRCQKVPLVCAWGLDKQLDPLIERCMSNIAGFRNIRGILAQGSHNKYRHPLPSLQTQQTAWLDGILSVLTTQASAPRQ
jgi:hypothetical protein